MKLEPELQESLRDEVAAFLDRLGESPGRNLYAPLVAVVEAGEVPDDLLDPLGRVLELSLGSGRLRKLHGPTVEAAAARLFWRTPRGAVVKRTFDEVNKALIGLQGQTVRSIELAPRIPGSYSVNVETDRCRVRLSLDESGAQCQGVEVGF